MNWRRELVSELDLTAERGEDGLVLTHNEKGGKKQVFPSLTSLLDPP